MSEVSVELLKIDAILIAVPARQVAQSEVALLRHAMIHKVLARWYGHARLIPVTVLIRHETPIEGLKPKLEEA